MKYWFNKLFITSLLVFATIISNAQPSLTPYNVVYASQSKNQLGSMPMGNGDIGSNIWVDTLGTIHFLISKTDTYSEIGRLLKIGQVDVKITPNILDAKQFSQTLIVHDGVIHIKANKGNQSVNILCYIDANHPVIQVQGNSTIPVQVEVTNAIWRKESSELIGHDRHSGYGVGFRETPFMKEKDTVLMQPNALIWVHQNKSSVWQLTLDNQNITSFNTIGKDPLLNQNFGAIVSGENFTKKNEYAIENKIPANQFNLQITILKKHTSDVNEWKKEIITLHKQIQNLNAIEKYQNHLNWWHQFWNNHYIIVNSKQEPSTTFKITQGYLLQRYLNACSGRGGMPIKFNGSIFTVAPDETLVDKKEVGLDADFRLWGANFWFQNTRIPYSTMYYSGDFALMKPFFDMYINAIPLAKYRTQKYFKHEGAYFPETLTPWGSYLNDNYGWDRSKYEDGVSENKYIRYYWQSGIELCKMMFDYYEFTNDKVLFQNKFVPFVKEIVTFYSQHYKKDASGKLSIQPAQSLETYFEGMVNPAPEIDGLNAVLLKIDEYKAAIKDPLFQQNCTQLQAMLPVLPKEKAEDGTWVLSSGLNLGKRMNIEDPQLYSVFPYRIYGIGKPNLELAINTFYKRHDLAFNGWQQDAVNAALLGLTEDAKKMVSTNFSSKHNGSRFPAFWGPNYDWVPDQDHGNITMRALQAMLVQSEKGYTYMLPAWPKDWDVQFKVNITGREQISGNYTQQKGLVLEKFNKNIPMKIMETK